MRITRIYLIDDDINNETMLIAISFAFCGLRVWTQKKYLHGMVATKIFSCQVSIVPCGVTRRPGYS